MAQWLNGLIRKIEGDNLYIDIGANLGIHGLHAAKANSHGTGRSVSSKNGSQRNGFHGEVLQTIGD